MRFKIEWIFFIIHFMRNDDKCTVYGRAKFSKKDDHLSDIKTHYLAQMSKSLNANLSNFETHSQIPLKL